MAIEVKSTQKISLHHLHGLKILQEEGVVFKRLIMVSHDLIETKKDGITCLHWQIFLKKLWGGELFS